MSRKVRICEAEFRRLWAAGMSRTDLALHFDCSVSWVDGFRAQLGLSARKSAVPRECYSPFDPTPEEIAERARECREKHYAQRRLETDSASRAKSWRGNLQEAG